MPSGRKEGSESLIKMFHIRFVICFYLQSGTIAVAVIHLVVVVAAAVFVDVAVVVVIDAASVVVVNIPNPSPDVVYQLLDCDKAVL